MPPVQAQEDHEGTAKADKGSCWATQTIWECSTC